MMKRNTLMLAVAALLSVGLVASPAQAQRDPAYQAARDSGQVGEKTDGYLGIVGTATPALQAMVDDLNNRRRANYAERAQANAVTLIDYATAQACILITRTVPGEMYQAPDGSWQQRGSGPPQLDPRCP